MGVVGGKMFPPEKVIEAHARAISKIGLPEWVERLTCKNCGEKLTQQCVRSIGLKTNAANIGDLAVEVICLNCNASYEVYYRRVCPTVPEFLRFVSGDDPGVPPVSQMEMKTTDNNLFDIMAAEQGKAPDVSEQ